MHAGHNAICITVASAPFFGGRNKKDYRSGRKIIRKLLTELTPRFCSSDLAEYVSQKGWSVLYFFLCILSGNHISVLLAGIPCNMAYACQEQSCFLRAGQEKCFLYMHCSPRERVTSSHELTEKFYRFNGNQVMAIKQLFESRFNDLFNLRKSPKAKT